MAKIAITPRGRTLLLEAVRNIERYPETFDMYHYMRRDERRRPPRQRPAPFCGTVACIAGHVCLAAGLPPRGYFYAHEPDLPEWFRAVLRRSSNGLWIGDAAAYLLRGRIRKTFPDPLTATLFHNFSITRRNVRAKVRAWLRTVRTTDRGGR